MDSFHQFRQLGDQVVERAAITEFLQFGNGITTSAYYHAFRDSKGRSLNGNNPHGYVLTFPAAERFWSVTAYTPNAIELVPNSARKYLVASYMPDCMARFSIFMATSPPAGVPIASWLPIPKRDFNIMLRIYGVVQGGDIANNTYVPPGIVKNLR